MTDTAKPGVWALTKLQYLLRVHPVNAFETLRNNGVKWKQHPDYLNLFQFRYDQLKTKYANKEVCESRGIILDKDNSWAIVAYPYNKFFNLGELYADEIDWNTAKTIEKLDGTLMILYHYEGWRVATLGMPDARGHVGDNDFTFADLFWEVWRACNYDLPDNTSCTYMFELIGPKNKVVVQYEKPEILLHGVRNNNSGTELSHTEVATRYRWREANVHSLATASDITDFINNRETGEELLYEGVVVVDGSFNRVKMKSDPYSLMHRLKGACSTTKLKMLNIDNSKEN
tara:strand:- start:14243 stop:15103 length:861 start_codon:yes stop_codon:yes gene_type:complete